MHKHFGLLFIIILSIYCAYTATSKAQDIYTDLKSLQNQIKILNSQRGKISKKLEDLQTENNQILNDADAMRYDAAIILHRQKAIENSNIRHSFLVSQSSFQDYFINKKRYEAQSQWAHYHLSQIIDKLLKSEALQRDIQNNLVVLDTLTLTINSYLEQIKTKNFQATFSNKEIEELKVQSLNLQNFINGLIDLQKKYDFKASKPPVFSLPVSGIIQPIEKPRNPSLFIMTSNNAIVQTPAAGQVMFADEFRNLGKIIIINHGYGYVSILRGFYNITVAQGTILNDGDVIGTVGAESWDKHPNKAMLSLELRYNNNLTNPLDKMTGL